MSGYSLSVGVIAYTDDKKVLLVRNPIRGWEFPGGQVEQGESIEIAATRETFEESGFQVRIERLCAVYQNLSQGVCSFIFRGLIVGGRACPSPESIEVGLFELEEAYRRVKWLNFVDRIRTCFEEQGKTPIISFYEPPNHN